MVKSSSSRNSAYAALWDFGYIIGQFSILARPLIREIGIDHYDFGVVSDNLSSAELSYMRLVSIFYDTIGHGELITPYNNRKSGKGYVHAIEISRAHILNARPA